MTIKRVAIVISVFLFTLIIGLFITYQYFAAKLIENSVAVVKADGNEIEMDISAMPAGVEEISEEEYRQSYEDEDNEISDEEFKKYIEDEYSGQKQETTEAAEETVISGVSGNLGGEVEFENDDLIFERVEITDRIYNVLLFGDDARVNEPRARSDSLILVSYNRDTKKIYLTSFMRDMLVPTTLGGGTWNRINAIYPAGGPGRAINILNNLFSMDMQRYAVVRFASVFALVDQLDGLDLELKANEAAVINRIFPEYDTVREGVNHLNGKQVLAYARMRHVDATGDFNRTQRQRYVLRKALEKALNSKNVNSLAALMTFAFDNVETNVPLGEALTLGYELFTGGKPEVEELRLPVDGSYSFARYHGASVFTIDFRKNILALHEFIYGSSAGVRIPYFNRPSMDAAGSDEDGEGDSEIGEGAEGAADGELSGGDTGGVTGGDTGGDTAVAGEINQAGTTEQPSEVSGRRGRTTTEPTDTADTAAKVLERRRRERAGELENPALSSGASVRGNAEGTSQENSADTAQADPAGTAQENSAGTAQADPAGTTIQTAPAERSSADNPASGGDADGTEPSG